ncbi:D-proline reductase (dithiol) protein PrdB [Clostridium beijerinckii]|jgi:D-proline reductase (dithiol) PrdB|uniref:D-proline reductase (Dithiol) protein PrdB n=1 Tax=Clostridium beijerinckii TaxID=1520 RepID=A0AAW3W9Y4_CLOBE|nr:D-proline reductase (dithiol) protein PrdB [Clostridium beijerinckii]MBC2458368.1 D-proline reductase (dithiol) protein PrdB [Clostridium beijerinckii]MBC2475710.1 D-proline reductase (dithiol) protein PrdB [Clostridium beijerinckii]MCI1579295.1 D-proline reductase (dithiol) protein PrdB [Clostridium beijerinckii]MCI1584393.1 D-proline reductase (dithiol) protein PrdB [Clostridium beijerinckii]MCI1622507.1 D-proline reductase (dithiol) protein PrdB [Clostridium beijerinckii]
MKLTTAEGMKSEIYVPITPPAVWTPLTKPLNECKVAFITAGGIHRKDQKPFNTAGDYSYRAIPTDIATSELMVTHGGFDNSDINKDVNAMLPLDRLRELVEEGFIGSLADEFYGFMGGGGNIDKFTNETGPEIAKKLKEQGVDIVVCTGGCGTCHRSAVIVERACEAAGMSSIIIAALPPIARQQGAPRITAPHVPIGSNAGEPNNKEMQTAILKDTLNAVVEMKSFGELKVLPYEYRHNV